MRDRGHAPQAVAHFVNRLVFCMFADDVGLLPEHMFTRMLRQARRTPEHFTKLAGALFRVMASGGRVGFEAVAWFNGGLFDDGEALPLEKADIDTVLAASDLDWSHCTDRDKIMLLVEPVLIRPLLATWKVEKTQISAELERADAARSPAARTKRRKEAERRYRAFLDRLPRFTVLDPACGSGNFLYLALQALKDLEHRVQLKAEALGFQRAFPASISLWRGGCRRMPASPSWVTPRAVPSMSLAIWRANGCVCRPTQTADQRRRPEAVDERHGPDAPPGGQVDRRFRVICSNTGPFSTSATQQLGHVRPDSIAEARELQR